MYHNGILDTRPTDNPMHGSAFDYRDYPEETGWICLGECYEHGNEHGLVMDGIGYVCPECGKRYANEGELARAVLKLLTVKEERIGELESERDYAVRQQEIAESKLAEVRRVAA